MTDDIRENGTPDQPGPGEGAQQQPPPPPGPQWQAPPPPPPQGGYYYPSPPPPPPYAPVGPPPNRPRRWLLPTALAVGCLPWIILFAVVMGGVASLGSGGIRGEHIALIRVEGVITGGKSSSGLFSESSAGSEDIIAQLEKARKDDGAKVVLIRINSPGGSAAGSEEVYDEINRVRADGKQVYASMGDVAASGGYYIASACDKIYADGATLTGSIGVIFHTADMSTLFKKIGYSPEVVKSGKFKDIGSPNRPMTPEERQLLQGMIDDIYVRFVKAVADGRHIPFADVKKIADGRIFTGSQAAKIKLVDEIGGLHDATLAAGKAGDIEGEPDVVEYRKKGFLGAFFGEEAASDRMNDAVTRRMLDELLRQGTSPTVR